jgi:peptide alpha-N-acetyltransferase
VNLRNLPENYVMKYYYYHLTLNPDVNFVALYDDKIVGYVLGKIEEDGDTYCGHLSSICVEEEYRQQGVAKSLLETLFGSIKAGIREKGPHQQTCKMYLCVRISNKTAIDFYTKTFGFTVASENKGYYNDGENAYRMEVSINLMDDKD